MAASKEIAREVLPFITVFSDGSIHRPINYPIVPPLLNDPQTGVSSKDIIISHDPTISARIYLPKIAMKENTDDEEKKKLIKLPVYVYFHGSAFVCESAFSKLFHDHFVSFVSQTNVIVVSVEYRLAPEHPLPIAYHDCWAALQWVASHSSNNKTEPWLTNHVDFNRVFIGGDSAGGNIVHNIIAFRVRVDQEPALPGNVKILGAVLAHPFFYSSHPIGSEPIIEPKHNTYLKLWNFAYPSATSGIDNPMVNPVGPGAPSLAGLGCSRMIVFVAGKDRLRERGVWYHELVKNSGWPGKLELFEQDGEGHDYHIFRPYTENAHKFVKRLASFLHE